MILARGFKPSPGGCLGAGVYVCVPRTEPEAVPPRAPRVPNPRSSRVLLWQRG